MLQSLFDKRFILMIACVTLGFDALESLIRVFLWPQFNSATGDIKEMTAPRVVGHFIAFVFCAALARAAYLHHEAEPKPEELDNA